jgi:hypothetical protein
MLTMSFLAYHLNRNAIHIVMDTGSTQADGTPSVHASKAFIVPHLQCLFTIRGLAFMGQAVFAAIQASGCADFDSLVKNFDSICEGAEDYVKALADADMISVLDDSHLGYEITLNGYSSSTGQMKVYSYRNSTDIDPVELSWSLLFIPQFFPPSDVPKNISRMKDPMANLVELAQLNHRHAVERNFYALGDPVPCRIGGGLTYFPVDRHGVTSKRLKTNLPDFNDFTSI